MLGGLYCVRPEFLKNPTGRLVPLDADQGGSSVHSCIHGPALQVVPFELDGTTRLTHVQ